VETLGHEVNVGLEDSLVTLGVKATLVTLVKLGTPEELATRDS
jgi:hypothetical protein